MVSPNPANRLIPFGKYAGQPIDQLANDPQYAEWLTGQNWFREKHRDLYQIVINNFAVPTETPEHNQLQAKFLDHQLLIELAQMCGIWRRNIRSFKAISQEKDFVSMHEDHDQFEVEELQFECKGFDVVFVCNRGQYSIEWRDGKQSKGRICTQTFGVELKPSLGDDYPAVLRQIKRCEFAYVRILVYEQFCASVEIALVKKIFAQDKIFVFSLNDIIGHRIDRIL